MMSSFGRVIALFGLCLGLVLVGSASRVLRRTDSHRNVRTSHAGSLVRRRARYRGLSSDASRTYRAKNVCASRQAYGAHQLHVLATCSNGPGESSGVLSSLVYR